MRDHSGPPPASPGPKSGDPASNRPDHRNLWWESPTREFGQVVHLELPEGFSCDRGGHLAEVQVAYESWGELNAARDNAVLVIHPMTADCHATGAFAGQPDGWWEPLIGPGRAIDTDRHFVVCPNLIGGCYGTTGPRFPDAEGRPYFDRFPLLTPRDMMRCQRLFLQQLGIHRIQMAIGPSMGGMIAWEWAIEASESVREVVVVAAPLRCTPHQIGMNWLQRRGIELDITENEVVAKWGQMVARGVGMLSYRSPVGLEEKFGREWFQEPGPTLKERGVFMVESWLRHHGKKITRRFDPYTYLLYSRAMDLHDVTDGRDVLVSVLDRIDCRVLVIGISTDNLYPPEDVHLAADMLDHLGKNVRYAEIRSPNGHDAFLLDTDQLDQMLRDLALDRPRQVPTREERKLREVKIGILGAGRVAASFLRLLEERRSHLADTHALRIEVAAVAEIDRERKLDPVFDGREVLFDPPALVERDDLAVILDLTRGSGAHALVRQALEQGLPVVTPNKALIRTHGKELTDLALARGVRLAWHDAIAAGWPLIFALERSMPRHEITAIRGALSSSCNVMLEQMATGVPFESAFAHAIERDLTEPDPDLDVSGWDSAQKLSILLGRIRGLRVAAEDLEVKGIRDLDPELIRRARDRGLRIRLVALALVDGHPRAAGSRLPERQGPAGTGELRATVRPMAVPEESHLGTVRGANQMVVLTTREAGELVYLGSGAGVLPVATAVLNDLVGLFDPRLSWTGRLPATAGPVPAPEFDQFLCLKEGRIRVTETESAGAVPLLDMTRE